MNYQFTVTEEEAYKIMHALSETSQNLKREADTLEKYNIAGIHTNQIELKIEHSAECERIRDKMYNQYVESWLTDEEI